MTARPADTADTRLRADARRNRDQIIAAAGRIFAERGTDVPMEEIARAARVGVGTLYRRFPDRDSLIRAVAVAISRSVLADARATVEQEPDAWHALSRFLRDTTGLRLMLQLVVLSPRARAIVHSDDEAQRIRDELMAILSTLVHAAQRDGTLRDDVTSGDIAVLLSLILRPVPGAPDELSETLPSRFLTLLLDGLLARPGTSLPGRAVSDGDLALLRRANRG